MGATPSVERREWRRADARMASGAMGKWSRSRSGKGAFVRGGCSYCGQRKERPAGSRVAEACPWRIANLPGILQLFASCYNSGMRDLVILFIHLTTTLARLSIPGGVRSVVAESLLIKHQLLILNRSRRRAPNLLRSDRILAGWCALFMRPSRLIRSAIVLKPSTLLHFHQILTKRKYHLLFSSKCRRKPGPKGPSHPKNLLTRLSPPNSATHPGAARESLSRWLGRSASPWPFTTDPCRTPAGRPG